MWPWVWWEIFRCTTKSMNHERKKIEKLDFIKIKNFHSMKDSVKIMKTQAADWEEIFAKHEPDKKLVSKIF